MEVIEPLSLTGEFADCCVAFAREPGGQTIVVLAPRLSSRVGFPPIGEAWRDTAVQLPNGFGDGRDLFTGETFAAAEVRSRSPELLRVCPSRPDCAVSSGVRTA